MAELREILVRRILTEKADMQRASNTFVFEVGIHANKPQILKAVETVFSVEVQSVRTTVVRGKVIARGGRPAGKRKNWKKAYVTLVQGHSIDNEGEE
jgi:large subunit ribosomal protein L23